MRGVARLTRGLDYGARKIGKAKRGPAVSTGIFGKRVSGRPTANAVKLRGRR